MKKKRKIWNSYRVRVGFEYQGRLIAKGSLYTLPYGGDYQAARNSLDPLYVNKTSVRGGLSNSFYLSYIRENSELFAKVISKGNISLIKLGVSNV